jgi:hypothetical protein
MPDETDKGCQADNGSNEVAGAPQSQAELAENNADSTKLLGGCTGKGFMPGQSGNPGGRPKKPIADALRRALGSSETVDEFVAGILKAAKSGNPQAFTAIRDTIEGKPNQTLEHVGEDGGPIAVKVTFVKSDGK